MVRKNAADFLSPEARKIGLNESNYLCFVKNQSESVVLRELIDKGLWAVSPNLSINTKIEEQINKLIKQHYPEYWEMRENAIAKQAESEQDSMPDVRKDIIFYDADYKEKFRIKDGDCIKITSGYDGKEFKEKCRHIDNHHIVVGTATYHVDEFMQRQTRVGNAYEPIPGQPPQMDILIAEPGKPPHDVEVPMSKIALCKLLGGEPEIVSKDMDSVIVKGINGNGTLLICGSKDNNLTSLHPYTAQSKKRELGMRYAGVEEKNMKDKPILTKRLNAGKEKAAAHKAPRNAPETPRKQKNKTEH
jgi:hypothetical protein